MTPHAPWTISCIRKAPIASHTALAANAQSGSTTSESTAAIMMVRRLPKRSESEPKDIPPIMAPTL